MQISQQAGNYDHQIILEIKTDSSFVRAQSISFTEDGIKIVIPVPKPNLGSCEQNQQSLQSESVVNPQEKQTTFSISLKSQLQEFTTSKIIQKASVTSTGTQTQSFANPIILVNNQQQVLPRQISDDQLYLNGFKTVSDINQTNSASSTITQQNDNSKQVQSESKTFQMCSNNTLTMGNTSFQFKKIFDLEQVDRARSRQKNIQYGFEIQKDFATQNKDRSQSKNQIKEEQRFQNQSSTNSLINLNQMESGLRNNSKPSIDYNSKTSHSNLIEAESLSESQYSSQTDFVKQCNLNKQNRQGRQIARLFQVEEIKKEDDHHDCDETESILMVDEAPFLPQPYTLIQKVETKNSIEIKMVPEVMMNALGIAQSSKMIQKQKECDKLINEVLKNKRKQQQQLDQKSTSSKHHRYQCKFCKKGFKQCAALGGHISKAHPGSSESYQQKMKVRQKREIERRLHKDAMQYYFDNYNARGDATLTLNRKTIKMIKKMIVDQREEYAELRPKYQNKDSVSIFELEKNASLVGIDDQKEESKIQDSFQEDSFEDTEEMQQMMEVERPSEKFQTESDSAIPINLTHIASTK